MYKSVEQKTKCKFIMNVLNAHTKNQGRPILVVLFYNRLTIYTKLINRNQITTKSNVCFCVTSNPRTNLYGTIGRMCASVLITNFSKSISFRSSLNNKYKYFNVSAKKKDSIISRGLVFSTLFTFPIDV